MLLSSSGLSATALTSKDRVDVARSSIDSSLNRRLTEEEVVELISSKRIFSVPFKIEPLKKESTKIKVKADLKNFITSILYIIKLLFYSNTLFITWPK